MIITKSGPKKNPLHISSLKTTFLPTLLHAVSRERNEKFNIT